MGVQHALGLACRARGVEQETGIFGRGIAASVSRRALLDQAPVVAVVRPARPVRDGDGVAQARQPRERRAAAFDRPPRCVIRTTAPLSSSR